MLYIAAYRLLMLGVAAEKGSGCEAAAVLLEIFASTCLPMEIAIFRNGVRWIVVLVIFKASGWYELDVMLQTWKSIKRQRRSFEMQCASQSCESNLRRQIVTIAVICVVASFCHLLCQCCDICLAAVGGEKKYLVLFAGVSKAISKASGAVSQSISSYSTFDLVGYLLQVVCADSRKFIHFFLAGVMQQAHTCVAHIYCG